MYESESALNRYVLSILVINESGVLTRLAGLFARRGYNIDSLSVGETLDKNYSRVTIALRGDEHILRQITEQIRKLHDVKKIIHLHADSSIYREFLLIKVKAGFEMRSAIIEIITVFRAKIVDFSANALTVELTGDSKKIDAFISLLEPYGIIEIARTGLTALERGEVSIYDYDSDNTEA